MGYIDTLKKYQTLRDEIKDIEHNKELDKNKEKIKDYHQLCERMLIMCEKLIEEKEKPKQ
jgi:hypothetical protein